MQKCLKQKNIVLCSKKMADIAIPLSMEQVQQEICIDIQRALAEFTA
jgi:hypothetical protein